MRVPLPGRDYFPPRVLLRGARSGLESLCAGMEPSPIGTPPARNDALALCAALPMPSEPSAGAMTGMRPAIA